MENGEVAVRDRIDGDLGALKVDDAIKKLKDEIAAKTVRKTFGGSAGLGDRGAKNEY
jgi:threonyl-tRNA synthetase